MNTQETDHQSSEQSEDTQKQAEPLELSETEIKALQGALKHVEKTMREWDEAATVSSEKMRRPLTR